MTRSAAYAAVFAALKNGDLERRPCEGCGATRAVAHHDDYGRPLDVRWLCRRCHSRHHAAHGSAPGALPAAHVSVLVRLPGELHAAIKDVAQAEDRSLNAQITRVIREWLAEQEREKRAQRSA